MSPVSPCGLTLNTIASSHQSIDIYGVLPQDLVSELSFDRLWPMVTIGQIDDPMASGGFRQPGNAKLDHFGCSVYHAGNIQ